MLITLIAQTAVTIFRTGKSDVGAASMIWMDNSGNVDVAKHIIHRETLGGWTVGIHGNPDSPFLVIPPQVETALDTPAQQLLALMSGNVQQYANPGQKVNDPMSSDREFAEGTYDPQADYGTAYKPGGFGMPAGMMGGPIPQGGFGGQAVPGGCGVFPYIRNETPFGNMMGNPLPGMMHAPWGVTPNVLPGLPIHCNFMGVTTEDSISPVALTMFHQGIAGIIPAWARMDWVKQNRCITPDEQDMLDLISKRL